jgi:hypothetical protein
MEQLLFFTPGERFGTMFQGEPRIFEVQENGEVKEVTP